MNFDTFERELKDELNHYSKDIESPYVYGYVEKIDRKEQIINDLEPLDRMLAIINYQRNRKGQKIGEGDFGQQEWDSKVGNEFAEKARRGIETECKDGDIVTLHFHFSSSKKDKSLKYYSDNYKTFYWICILEKSSIVRYGKVEVKD